MVLKALQEGNKTEAQSFWDKLHSETPEAFGPNFKYNAEVCVFSLCLEKQLSSMAQKIEVPDMVKGQKSKQALLKMKIPHENGGNSLTLKTTNIRETILFD